MYVTFLYPRESHTCKSWPVIAEYLEHFSAIHYGLSVTIYSLNIPILMKEERGKGKRLT